MLKAVHSRFRTGATKSPRHALLGALPFRPLTVPPAQFGVVPPKLNVWGNATYGDCVSAEEAYAKACWSIMCGLPEVFATEAEVVAFASRYGYLNGATLTEVMDTMARYGMTVGGSNYKDGGYLGVDYSNESVLQAAIAEGPVKIAIDAGALPDHAGSANGWYDVSGGSFPNTDHCVGLSGYGAAAYLYGLMGVPVPAGLVTSQPGYLLFTWGTVGFVTHAWLMGTCVEAWVRNPTTVGQTPVPSPTPNPSPDPTPAPTPSPVPPPPPTPIISDVVVTGQIPSGAFGHLVTVTLKGTATPRNNSFHGTDEARHCGERFIVTAIGEGLWLPTWATDLLASVEALAAKYGGDVTDITAKLVAFCSVPSWSGWLDLKAAVDAFIGHTQAKAMGYAGGTFGAFDPTPWLVLITQLLALWQQLHPTPKPA